MANNKAPIKRKLPHIRTELLSAKAMRAQAEKWKREKSAAPYVVIVGVLAAYLAFGTVCILQVIWEHFIR